LRSNITTDWSFPDVAKPWPAPSAIVSAVDASHFTQQRAGVLVDDHYARLARDEHAVIRRIRRSCG
jgi:hypothetical protein